MCGRIVGGLILLLIVIGSQGCGDPRADGVSGLPDGAPLHAHVLCMGRGAGPATSCPVAEREAALEAWMSEALLRADSTFTIWEVGPHHYVPAFAACVPRAWGQGVIQAKAAFMRAAREGARGPWKGEGLGAVPSGCRPPAGTTPGMHRLYVTTGAPGDPTVWDKVASPEPMAQPVHMAVVCDQSNSTMNVACTTGALTGAFDGWVADARGAPGSSFSVYAVGSSRDTTRVLHRFAIPKRSAGERAAFLLAERLGLIRVLDDASEPKASAVAEALSVAVSDLRERSPGRRRVVLLSDLRQVSPGIWNFEHAVPSTERFTRWLRDRGLFVDLRDVWVTACGLHHRRGPGASPFDGALAAVLHDLWESTLRAMGSPDVQLNNTCETAFAAR